MATIHQKAEIVIQGAIAAFVQNALNPATCFREGIRRVLEPTNPAYSQTHSELKYLYSTLFKASPYENTSGKAFDMLRWFPHRSDYFELGFMLLMMYEYMVSEMGANRVDYDQTIVTSATHAIE